MPIESPKQIEKMKLIFHAFYSLCLAITITMALAISLSKPGCPEKCGNITIPYPFGIGPDCSANSSFILTCNYLTNPPVLTLSSIKLEVVSISLFGTIIVKQPVFPMSCSHVQRTQYLPVSLDETPFTFSARYNSLAVLGCKNSVWLHANQTETLGGCTALCDPNSTPTTCNGVNCCQTTIPSRLKVLHYTYKSNEPRPHIGSCGYAFPVEKKWLKNLDQSETVFVPLVLEWELGELKGFSSDICTYSDDTCLTYPDDSGHRFPIYEEEVRFSKFNCSSSDRRREYGNLYAFSTGEDSFSGENYEYHTTNYYPRTYEYVSLTKYCSCPRGFEGNPYLPKGCADIDECSNSTLHHCLPAFSTCINHPGAYSCDRNYSHNKNYKLSKTPHLKIAVIITSSMFLCLILLLAAWRLSKGIKKVIKANRRRKYFKRNGGLLLEQHLSATQNGLERTKLFSSLELTKATDHYNENRILGRGGQGTVYKGMLTDGRIVAVKKSKEVEEGDVEVFINELVILSQLNHRNVVKLLGCCLETEVPLLVYEFIPNGTLLQHIHEPNEELPLTWEMRVRVAREVAGALAHLHSSSSALIYHRDIKTANILLDDKYRAKVADFGISRSVSIDQTHLTTRAVGTFGYMDPEYVQSNQFTDKCDVYSFGVVMVELLTGEEVIIPATGVETRRGLARRFLDSMEENTLFEILDARVVEEGKREEIVAMAKLARRCVNVIGTERPTMNEVAMELERIQMVNEASTDLADSEE